MKRLLFLFILLSAFFSSQVIKDSIFGKPKFIKESVIFLNDSGPFTFMKGDDEYGHAVIMTPKNLRNRMKDTWFETNFCRYINNEVYFDKNRNIIKEIWYYKSGEIVDDYTYVYDDLNRIITESSKNKYSEKSSHYFYDKNSKIAKFKKYYYKWENEPLEIFVNNLESFKPLFVTKFDTISKTDSIFAITNDIWKSVDERSYTRAKDSIYHKRLTRIKVYDKQYRVVEEKFFNYEEDFQNKRVSLTRHLKYEYDKVGNLAKQIDFKDGKFYSYIMFENGRIIREEKNDDYGKTSYTVYTYTKDQKLERRTMYYNDKIWYDLRFVYDGNYITKLYYLDKYGSEDKDIEPTVITFKYTFDKQKNWKKIIKNVDGKDLYMWTREIEYYK
ncbi:hypothetical protein [Chryseobacterium paridis]|uniref:Sugar-binding protein n=1 Tax=Chryseobacterium paridis TaxID=2800328 RepID=A0ABS1FXI2_9FLAO|nr:hypothetical protein [Chryseobacterium paridis]MBK1896899.1 hypothetical protein [Chryseobacterium paridis]